MTRKLAQSSVQTIKFFEEFIRKTEVTTFIKKFRKRLGIPKEGFILTDTDIEEFNQEIVMMLYIPSKVFLVNGNIKVRDGLSIIKTCDTVVVSQGVESLYVKVMLRFFLVFNKIIDVSDHPLLLQGGDDLLTLEYLPGELSFFDSEDHYLLKCMYVRYDYIAKRYPVALYINSEASQNQVKDFISKNWNTIKAHQNMNKKILFSGIRQKRRQKVNDFIYENKELSIAKIRTKLREEMNEYLDDGHIGKIIQLERKRRN